ncbi:MAG: hypothetical protein WBY88_14550 [Desulfosarcina sp.]
MFNRNKQLVTIASEETLSFVMCHDRGAVAILASLPLADFLKGAEGASSLPRAVLQSVNTLLVIPDYWVGNRFDEFPSRKKSVACAFIERKLRADQPGLTGGGDFYDYAVFTGQDQRLQLYTIYLQEPVAYQLYRRLEALDLSPTHMASPALLWQARLGELAPEFAQSGVGLIHRLGAECWLYFFFMGQFLFSRNIQLPDDGQIENLLNYEINQSFYLYSQKTKSSVDHLYMLTPSSDERSHLSDLLGRPVNALPDPPSQSVLLVDETLPPSCRAFAVGDLDRSNTLGIAYKPLKKELYWRPVQWAGIAVGLVLIVLLMVESGYLRSWSTAVDRQLSGLIAADPRPPELVLGEISQAVEEIARTLQRPTGSTAALQTLLAAPDALSINRIALDASEVPHLNVSARVHADDPDQLKVVLKAFLDRLNERFDLMAGPLLEKDVDISLERGEDDRMPPQYLIHLGFEL